MCLTVFRAPCTQADDLERICREHSLRCTMVLHMVVDPDLLMRRLTGRRICKADGHIYNIYDRPPRREGICDVDGSELIHRPDDTEGVISERLAAYDRANAAPGGVLPHAGPLESRGCHGRRGRRDRGH